MPQLNSPSTYIFETQLRGSTIPVWRFPLLCHCRIGLSTGRYWRSPFLQSACVIQTT